MCVYPSVHMCICVSCAISTLINHSSLNKLTRAKPVSVSAPEDLSLLLVVLNVISDMHKVQVSSQTT